MSESDEGLFVKVETNHCNRCKHHYEDHFTDGPYPYSRPRTCVCGMQKCCRNQCGCFEFVPDFSKVPYVPVPKPHEQRYSLVITTNEFDYSQLDAHLKNGDVRDLQIKEYYPLAEIKGSLPSHIFRSDPSLDYLTKHTYDSGVSSGGAVNPVSMLSRIDKECKAIRRRARKGRLWAIKRYKIMGWKWTFVQLEAYELKEEGELVS
jgi:hypothetical protein